MAFSSQRIQPGSCTMGPPHMLGMMGVSFLEIDWPSKSGEGAI
jgi:hypothetical protein